MEVFRFFSWWNIAVNRYWLGGVQRKYTSVILFVYSVILSCNENFRNLISLPDKTVSGRIEATS